MTTLVILGGVLLALACLVAAAHLCARPRAALPAEDQRLLDAHAAHEREKAEKQKAREQVCPHDRTGEHTGYDDTRIVCLQCAKSVVVQ